MYYCSLVRSGRILSQRAVLSRKKYIKHSSRTKVLRIRTSNLIGTNNQMRMESCESPDADGGVPLSQVDQMLLGKWPMRRLCSYRAQKGSAFQILFSGYRMADSRDSPKRFVCYLATCFVGLATSHGCPQMTWGRGRWRTRSNVRAFPRSSMSASPLRKTGRNGDSGLTPIPDLLMPVGFL